MIASLRRPGSLSGLLVTLAVLALFVSAAPAGAQNINGAIFTTFADGTTVNGNIYPSKASVYLNGGPQNEHAAGLPDGTYYFQVTDPAAKVLLSTDDISCRQLVVGHGTGTVDGVVLGATGPCPHANGAQNNNNGGSIPVQLIPFNDTPNTGGEYKVWLTNVNDYDPVNCGNFGFCDDKSKTDNFKIQEPAAHIKVCKFNDLNDNGLQDDGEPLIPHWPITATGVNSTPINTQTDDNGCVSFTIASFSNPDGTETVTFTEGTQGPTWAQTAPPDGSCTLTANSGSVNALDACSVSGGVITLTISPGEDLSAPNFGNNSNCANNNSCTEPPVVTKTANPSLTRTYKWTITKSVDKTEIDTSGNATFNYTVSVSHDNGTDSGWQATGSIRVSNPNSTDMTGVSVGDAVDNGGSCTVDTTGFSGTVPADSHIDFPYTCTYTSLPPAGTNTATATSDDGSGTGTASVDFSQATINIVDGTITVTDTFGGTLGTASYTDTNPKTFTYSHTFTDPAGTCTTHDNTATFTTDTSGTTGSDTKTVKVCVGADLSVSKTAVAAFNSAITKNVDHTLIEQSSSSITFNYTVNVTTSNWTVSGNITVTNPNNWEAITANASDLLSDSGGSCSITGGTNVSVAASSSVTLPYTCTFALVPTASSGTNTGTATWDATAFFTPDGSASGNAGYSFAPLTVTDTFKGTLGTVTIPPGSATFTYSRTVTVAPGTCQSFDNTATIVQTNQSASKTVKGCVGADLTVSKTAVAGYNAAITKNVDHTLIEQAGSSITFNYMVNVTTNTWAISGNITVNNPNNWEAVTANVSDLLSDSGGVCSVTGGSSVTIAASSSVTLPYVCTFALVPTASSGVNTGTATWNAAAFFTPDGSASGNAGYSFAPLTVTDTFKGALGTVTIPPGSATFTYSRTVTVAPGTCQNFDNTATIVQTNQSASKTVTACNTNTGALTMGFWQNKNGQGIITNFCGGTSGVSLDTFLRQFNPFQDLSATATCSQDASYVTGIIKAATCTSSTNTCNSMLRSQMLATALDVYFSDPTLGGNQIGAFNGLGGTTPALGGVAIDLSKICAMLDGSGGGTCSGVTEDARPEFGIAPPALGTTVGLMLLYSDFLSGVNGSPVATSTNGSTWYNNIKARQVIAKDAFDSINNTKALIAPAGTTASPSF